MTSDKGVNSMHYRFFDADMGLAYGALQALLPLDVAGTLCGDGCGGRLAARINMAHFVALVFLASCALAISVFVTSVVELASIDCPCGSCTIVEAIGILPGEKIQGNGSSRGRFV